MGRYSRNFFQADRTLVVTAESDLLGNWDIYQRQGSCWKIWKSSGSRHRLDYR